MEFKKCERCGCFYTTSDSICPKCQPKENFEMNIVKNFLKTHNEISTQSISNATGISTKTINRFLKSDELSSILNTPNNIKMNL